MMKRVVIFTHEVDSSTDDVIHWFAHYGIPYLRLNENDYLKNVQIQLPDNKLILSYFYKNSIVHTDEETNFWFRRPGGINFFFPADVQISHEYNRYQRREYEKIKLFFNTAISATSKFLNKIGEDSDKLNHLYMATASGLKIPDTIITSSISDLIAFKIKHKKIITKALYMPYFTAWDEGKPLEFAHSTNLVRDEDINFFRSQIGEFFFPTLFQSYVEKFIELRIFYLNESIYTMGIFSQQNEKTKIDFRKYDREKPNRLVPYTLPKALEDQIKVFMSKANLNCGSLDFILTPQNEYVFLEVNPIGQFQWLSSNCNYYIEKKIAGFFYE